MVLPHQRWLAWQESHTLVLLVYRATQSWPTQERFGLTAQIRRAAVSVPTNLAEGSARLGARELRRFADIAFGSLSELHSLMMIAHGLGFLSQEQFAELELQRDKTGRLVFGLLRAMSRRSAAEGRRA